MSAEPSAAAALDQPEKKGKRRRRRRRSRRASAGASPDRQANGEARTALIRGIRGGESARPQPAPTPRQPVEKPAAPSVANGRRLSPVYAALDLGTNNCRLLVAIPQRPGQFRVIDAFSRIVRLGEGLGATGRLGDAAMDRAVEALKVCADKLAIRDLRCTRLIATEACRSASNGDEFLSRVRRETGLELEIIDRQTEARLAVSGCGSLIENDTRGVVIFDIGGGSSEIALVDLSGRRSQRLSDHISAWTSLPVGVVSLAERFGGRHVGPDVFAAMVREVNGLLAGFEGREALAHLQASGFHLLGTSGTVTTLAGVHLDLPRYDRRRVDGLWMNSGEIDLMVARLLGWSFDERVANPCIGPDRADLVLAGCAILEAIRETWPSGRLRVADRGLREGILSELMSQDGAWRQQAGAHRQ
jgi:exopolyphosphatase/guanosine-5'-triphosphate,3'-diphosphate pyrophosphatase